MIYATGLNSMQENPNHASQPDRLASRRETIVEASVELFARHGLDGTTMRDIAAAAGLRAASTYHHFASKEALFLAAHELAINRLRASVLAAIAPDAAAWEQLDQAARGYLQIMLTQPHYAQLIVIEATSRRSDPPLAQPVREQRRFFEQPFAEIVARLPLRRGVDRSAFRLAVLGMLAWTHTWWRRDGDDPPARVAAKIIALLRDHSGRPEMLAVHAR
jgi:AcrR family transcriptional regulator